MQFPCSVGRGRRCLPAVVSVVCFWLMGGAGLRADSSAPAGTVETTSADSPYGEGTVVRNVPYVADAGPLQTFDLYLPKEKGDRPLPFVFWLHGGAWELHSKEWDNVKYLVRHGYAIATVDYRLSPPHRFPVHIQDCNAALNFLVAHAASYGLDPKRFVVGGASAGGHLCLLLGMARHEKAFGADPAVRPLAILDFFGATDLNGIDADTQAAHMEKAIKLHDRVLPQFLGASPAQNPATARAASPLTYVGADVAPVLILHGTADELVPFAQSERLHARLDAAGVKNELITIEGAPHDGPKFSTPEVQAKVLDFLHNVLR